MSSRRAIQVGPVEIRPNLILSPMSGVTDSPFRRMVKLASGDAVGLLVTEFISVEGLTRGNLRTAMRLHFKPEVERPLSVQIFGSEKVRMADAAEIAVDHGADIIDINCGCPAPKVVRKGGGADLHRDIPRLVTILDAVRERIGDVPLTLKMRSGWDDTQLNAVDVAKAAVDCGVQMLAIHGRTRVQLYTGQADWDIIGEVAEAVDVPVVGSGDILTHEDAQRHLERTGCAGVMIGRGAIMNPWIFRQILDGLEGRPITVPTYADRIQLLREFRVMLEDSLPARAIPGRLKQVIARFSKGLRHGVALRRTALVASDPDVILARAEAFFDDLEHGRHPNEDAIATAA